jgi:hypothetical protein
MHYASNFLAVYPDIQTDPHILYIRHHQTKKKHSPAWLPQRASLRNVRAAPGSVQGQTVELGKARNNWNIPNIQVGFKRI